MNTAPSPYQIKAFTYTAREGSFSEAAKTLGVSQSSVTQHIAKLESLMGTQLFIRRRGGLELTRAAKELFAISDRLATLEQLINEKIGDYGALTDGHIRLIANAPAPPCRSSQNMANAFQVCRSTSHSMTGPRP